MWVTATATVMSGMRNFKLKGKLCVPIHDQSVHEVWEGSNMISTDRVHWLTEKRNLLQVTGLTK